MRERMRERLAERSREEFERVADFARSWRMRWALIKVVFLGSGEQCHAAIHAAIEAYEPEDECCCRAHRGAASAPPYSVGPPVEQAARVHYSAPATAASGILMPIEFDRPGRVTNPGTDESTQGFGAPGAGQWARETARDRTRYGGPDAHPETIRLGVARGERPQRGTVLPVSVGLFTEAETPTPDEREAWFMPPGMIGSLTLVAACPLCGLAVRHPCIGANGTAVLLCCDDRACAHVWSVRGYRELYAAKARRVDS